MFNAATDNKTHTVAQAVLYNLFIYFLLPIFNCTYLNQAILKTDEQKNEFIWQSNYKNN